MFIGHYAVGFALKRAAPAVSLGWLFAAVQLPDLLWPVLLLLGVEQVRVDPGNTAFTPLDFVSYPYSHSLLLVCVWSAAFGLLYHVRHSRGAAGVVLAAAVASHWVLDWIVHRPDLPVAPWSGARAGLSLWNSIPGTLAIEVPMYLIGVWLYARSTRPYRRAGRLGFVALAVFLALVYAANLLGPPPPDSRTVAFVTMSLWLLPPWAAWCDAGRRVRADKLREQ